MRIFITGRYRIREEIENHLAALVRGVCLGRSKYNIAEYLRLRLGEGEKPDEMDGRESRGRYLEKHSGKYVENVCRGNAAGNPTIHNWLIDIHLGFYKFL